MLLHTGGETHLTAAGARWLAEHGARLVGTDAGSIGDPARSVLLAAGVPVVDHLTGLDRLPPTGAGFTAVPPRGAGTSAVRAYAALPVSPRRP